LTCKQPSSASKQIQLTVLQATEALRITADQLVRLEVMDEVIPEPLGGAHSDPVAAFPSIKAAIMGTFRHYENMTEREIQLDRCG
jgi:acetyl-CoA carboxylase alpha subunit